MHFLEALSFVCHFVVFFVILVICAKKMTKFYNKWQTNTNLQVAKTHFSRGIVIFLPFCCHVLYFFVIFDIFPYTHTYIHKKLERNDKQNDIPKLKWQKHWQTNGQQKWQTKSDMTKNMTQNDRPKLKWQKQWQKQRQTNDKITTSTISRVWLQVSSNRKWRFSLPGKIMERTGDFPSNHVWLPQGNYQTIPIHKY